MGISGTAAIWTDWASSFTFVDDFGLQKSVRTSHEIVALTLR
jgi:hypothetical protein